MVMTDTTMIDRLKQFVESEMRSCSMDIGGITPLYVYRMWGGAVAIEDIVTAMEEVRRGDVRGMVAMKTIQEVNPALAYCEGMLWAAFGVRIFSDNAKEWQCDAVKKYAK